MTNDDRSNEDRTGAGQAPRWGEAQEPAAAAPAADEPRYGERTPAEAPRYGERAPEGDTPQYGQQQYGQQPYGQQHDQQQYGQQPYAASSAPASAGAPAWQAHEEPKRKKKTIGVVAFILGLLALVLGVIGGYIMGSALANSDAIGSIVQNGGTTSFNQEDATRDLMNDPAVVSQLAGGAVVAGIAAILGLWALVQGIIAVVAKRGRGWGVFAIVLAVVATIATFGTYIGVAAAAAAGAGS
jgi:hypothetical protein